MKLRIRGDSLRFRLTQREVSELLAGSRVSESVHFFPGSDVLTYSLEPMKDGELSASFAEREILVGVPRAMVEPWARTEQVGIESRQAASGEKNLRIIIEKDFRCLQPRPEEDERDNFPHPEAVATEQGGGCEN